MSRSRCRQGFSHSSSAHSFPVPPPPPPPPPVSSTSVQHGGHHSSTLQAPRCRPCSVCSTAARYSLVLDELQTYDQLPTMTSPTPQTGNGTRPPGVRHDSATLSCPGPPACNTWTTAGQRVAGWRVVPGRCRGRMSACSLVLLPMAALLSLQALWVANSWQVSLSTGQICEVPSKLLESKWHASFSLVLVLFLHVHVGTASVQFLIRTYTPCRTQKFLL